MKISLSERGWFNIAVAFVWVAAYFVSRAVLGSVELGTTGKVFVALIPAVPFAAFLWLFIKNIAHLDEMQRKIQLEAIAFAFPLSILLLMVLGLLQLAIVLPEDDLSYRHVWPFLPLLYFAGLALAWRRYK